MTPALTEKEWASRAFLEHDGCNPEVRANGELYIEGQAVKGRERHAVAALAMHGQPFRFTWEMVDAIRKIVGSTRGPGFLPEIGVGFGTAYGPYHWASLAADRIEALLPPREEEG